MVPASGRRPCGAEPVTGSERLYDPHPPSRDLRAIMASLTAGHAAPTPPSHTRSTKPADVLVLHAAREAFKQAADPNCFPEQITDLGLKPWAAKKLYALGTDPKAASTPYPRADP